MISGRLFVLLAGITLISACAKGEEQLQQGLNPLPEIDFSSLSQHDTNPLAAKALTITPQAWRHGETDHFIYHFVHSYVVTPLAVEAEFYFRVIAKELGQAETAAAGGKSDIYIFEKPDDWKIFQTHADLEPWTGGIHSRGSLFIVRDPSYKFAGHSLGHEIAHLLLFRFYGDNIPRWLNEGFAEYVSRIGHASFQRARDYHAQAHSRSISTDRLIPLSQLIAMDYPPAEKISTFYDQSERLVRFLITTNKASFLNMLGALAKGEPFDTALSRNYSGRFLDVSALEQEFAAYASKDAGTSFSTE